MAVTPSVMLPLCTELPAFSLLDTRTGSSLSSDTLKGKSVVVGFICNHCPFVIHLLPQLVEACHEFQEQGVEVIMISSNNPITHPQDGPEKMTEHGQKSGFRFPYCFDETQSVAKAFQAACTPEFYVFDDQHKLTYRGRFDDSRPNNGKPVTGQDLRSAVELLKSGQILETQVASVGCGIKWK